MTLPRNLAPRAIRDVEDAATWFADGQGGEDLARRCAKAVAAAAGRISQRPLLGHRRAAFEAWTKPELFQQWWAPKSFGVSLISYEADVRTGAHTVQ